MEKNSAGRKRTKTKKKVISGIMIGDELWLTEYITLEALR